MPSIYTPLPQTKQRNAPWTKASRYLKIDALLLGLLLLIASCGLFLLYSASHGSGVLVVKQGIHFLIGFGFMLIAAYIPPRYYQYIAYPAFAFGLLMLCGVMILGHVGKGAQRWLSLGGIGLQPSECIKLILPLTLAHFLSSPDRTLDLKTLAKALLFILPPVLMTAAQPDLGTATLILLTCTTMLYLAGLSWKVMLSVVVIACLASPFVWHHLHTYQQERILSFLHPERDPLGAGYHIIQSKIAIGSGGFWGKGWFNSTQAYLHFLPEHTTDFIFAVLAEEFGFAGGCLFFLLLFAVFFRSIQLSQCSQSRFAYYLSGGLSFNFFLSVIVNTGMVTGILPVVGIPLPMVSYGGTALIIQCTAFGIIMSLYTHRGLLRERKN